MIKKYIFLGVTFLISLGLISGITNGSQAPFGHTGSVGDAKNCTVCHSGAAPLTDNNISTNIPVTGYIPGTTYTITLDVTKAGINKFGFQLTSENSSGIKKGAFIITNASQTKMIQSEVTHTGNGTGATNNQKVWSVDWTAPAAGTGTIFFFSAINAANGDGGVNGDQIILSSTSISEDLSASINNESLNNFISVFPTVASEVVNVTSSSKIQQIRVYDTTGKLFLNIDNQNNASAQIDVSSLQSGVYLATIKTSTQIRTLKFIKR